jgi:L-seryl-tRNA(Ser) seleniumtransferase
MWRAMKTNAAKLLRALPAINAVLELDAAKKATDKYGRSAVTDSVRYTVDHLRGAIRAGKSVEGLDCEAASVLASVIDRLDRSSKPLLNRVINATGIILHTGLGRAHMPDAAREALATVAGYCNVQMDLETSKRSRREGNVLQLIRDLTGAEDACVVNNNAGATMLVLKALAEGKEVVVSRGELIEIGGSFRLPDIMSESGATMREIGTTNKTHPRDYEKAIGKNTGLLFKAHKSNYKMIGFTTEVGIGEIVKIGKKKRIPVVDDLGAGALIGLEQFGLPHESTVQESIKAGADVVLFSTDKLIGGPQGGMIVGKEKFITRIRKHPLYRVLRVCKLTLGALEATLKLFKSPELLAAKHPIYMMLARTPAELEESAAKLADLIFQKKPRWNVSVIKTTSYLGGGSLPEESMPSFAVKITSKSCSTDELARRFRTASTPVIPRIAGNAVLLDMRTVLAGDVREILGAVEQVHGCGSRA